MIDDSILEVSSGEAANIELHRQLAVHNIKDMDEVEDVQSYRSQINNATHYRVTLKPLPSPPTQL